MNKIEKIALWVLGLSLAGTAYGTVLLSETYDDLSTGSMSPQNGWSITYRTAPEVVIPGVGGEGKGMIAARGGVAKAIGSSVNPGQDLLYLSANMIYTEEPSTERLSLGLSLGADNNKIEFQFAADGFRAYLNGIGNVPATAIPISVSAGIRYIAIAKIEPNASTNCTISFGIFDVSGGSLPAESELEWAYSAAVNLDSLTPEEFTHFNILQGNSSLLADNIQLSTTWDDVLASVISRPIPPTTWIPPQLAFDSSGSNTVISSTNLIITAPNMLQMTNDLTSEPWTDVLPAVEGLACTNWTVETPGPQRSFRIKSFKYARGGPFKDFILPIPIVDGLESEGIWGNENVIPRDADNGIEDNEWCYWGGNPILGNDGKYHLAVCRWLESTGHGGWLGAEIAHSVSDTPLGPYVITQPIAMGYNPEAMKMADGSFALHFHNGSAEIFVADNMPGPWSRLGVMTLDSRNLQPTDSDRIASNLTTEIRPDGSILLMKKDGFTAISNTGVLGPYLLVSRDNYTRNSGYAEDPVIWRSQHQYHCIYNHAAPGKSGYMRSLDGIYWKNENGLPYDVSTTVYEDGTSNEWYKFERPKVLQDAQGRASHFSLAVMDVAKGADKGNDIHSSKNLIMPVVVEKFISIVETAPITAATSNITVLIKAEPGFDPLTELDLDSLRFGSDSLVNLGAGCKAVQSTAVGQDLQVLFRGDHGINRFDFDCKLLGQTTQGGIVFGYALLPGKSPVAATLIALPVRLIGTNVTSTIENWGFETSTATTAVFFEHSVSGRIRLGSAEIPALDPYGSHLVSFGINNPNAADCEYSVRIVGNDHCKGYWRMVDDTDPAVAFLGDWVPRPESNSRCYMNNERVTVNLGDSVKFTFTGSKAAAYGYLGNDMGNFQVYIDGEYVENLRLTYGGDMSRLYQTPLLPEGLHTLELVAVKSGTTCKAAIDAFAYESISNKVDYIE